MDPSCLLMENYSTPPAVQLAQLQHKQYIKTEMSARSKHNAEMFFEIEAYRVDDGDDKLLVFFAHNISGSKWIEKQIAAQPVLCSGILNKDYVIERYELYIDAAADHKTSYENVSIFELITPEQQPHLKQTFEEINVAKQSKHIILRTTKLADHLAYELRMTVHPLLDGFGQLQDYAFVICHLKPFEESSDPSVRLKIIMAQRNITVQWLSEATGITVQTISKLRNGKIRKPQQLTAKLIACELGVAVSDIWPETRRG